MAIIDHNQGSNLEAPVHPDQGSIDVTPNDSGLPVAPAENGSLPVAPEFTPTRIEDVEVPFLKRTSTKIAAVFGAVALVAAGAFAAGRSGESEDRIVSDIPVAAAEGPGATENATEETGTDLIPLKITTGEPYYEYISVLESHQLNADIENVDVIFEDILFYMNDTYSNPNGGSLSSWRYFAGSDSEVVAMQSEQVHIAGSYDGSFEISGQLIGYQVVGDQLIIAGDVNLDASFRGEAQGSRDYAGAAIWTLSRIAPPEGVHFSGSSDSNEWLWMVTEIDQVTESELQALSLIPKTE